MANDVPFDDEIVFGQPKAPGEKRAFSDGPRQAPPDFKPIEERIFTEPCPKCHGTGKFRSWSGRAVGDCFTCKGSGKKTFKTPKEDRARAQAQRVVRSAKKELQNIEGFKAAHPDVWAWMDGSTFEFAVSLRESVAKWGSLTDGQMAAAQKCLDRYNAKVAERKAAEARKVEIDVTKIVETIEHAEASLKRPILRSFGVKIMRGKPHWNHPDAIHIFGDDGRAGIIENGTLRVMRGMTEEIEKSLQCIAIDPKEAALQYGKETGICGCCGATLTDPVSIEKGIGPICESKWF